jgi:hypothetical protein
MSLTAFRLGVIKSVVIACVVVASPSFAQEFRATVTGQVSDSSGAPVPAATVTAVQQDTNQAYTAKSNAAGVFSVEYVNPGQYKVTVEATGFSAQVYPNVTLAAGQTLNLNVTLKVGSVHEQVTVEASPGLLDTASAASGGAIDQTKVETLPSDNGRSVWANVEFTQGVRSTGYGDIVSYVFNPSGVGGNISFNGSPTGQSTYYVNGAPVSPQGTVQFTPQADSVEEVEAVGDSGAQYGPGAGGTFTSVIKQGTNQFHGSAFDYLSNKLINANAWANNLTGLPRAANTHNDFGGTVGGPIRKDKTFFFFGFEAERTDQPQSSTDSVPTAAMRAGNFTGTGYTIYDPATVTCAQTSGAGCSRYSRDAFPNDTVPQSRVSPIGAAIMNLYPNPTGPGVASNFSAQSPRYTNYTQYIGRADHYFSEANRLSGVFSYQSTLLALTTSNSFPGVGTIDTQPTSHDANGMLDFTHTFSSSMLADIRLSFGRYTSFSVAGIAVQDNYSVPGLTMPFVPTTPHQNIAPSITFGNGYTSMIGNTANGTVNNYWQFSPVLSQVKGRHNLRYGFQFMDIQTGASGIPGSPNGTFAFSGVWTQQNPLTAAAGSGNSLADLLLGYPASGSVDWSINTLVAYHYYAGYVQDDFKVSRTLTLNLGLRWDAYTSPTERHDDINGSFCFTCTNPYSAQINYAAYPTLQNPLLGGATFTGVSAPRDPYNVKLDQFQPRFGLAWAITPGTVLRAGFGIFYGVANPATSSTGFDQTTPYITSLDGGVDPTNYFLSGKPYPTGAVAPAGASAGLKTDAGQGITYNSGYNVIPSTKHWTIGFQRQLPKQILLDVEYVGSYTHGLAVSTPWDVISSAQQAACFQNNAICNTTVSNPFYGILPSNVPVGSSPTIPAWELMRQYPLFNGITQSNNPAGHSVYNALETRVERKIKSLDFVANYTWSNNMYANSYLNSGNFVDNSLFYGPWSSEQRQYFNADVVWPLPVGKGGTFFRDARGFLGALINNWQGISAVRYFTGYPLSMPSANLTGAPGCTSYVPAGGQTRQHWFNNNESCYQTLNQWQRRTAPLYVGYLREPNYYDWNSSLEKRFELPERMTMEFRVECSNCANSHRWGQANTTLSAIPTFTPAIGWTGFGTLGTTNQGSPRFWIFALKLLF